MNRSKYKHIHSTGEHRLPAIQQWGERILLSLCVVLLFACCQRDDDDDTDPTPQVEDYMYSAIELDQASVKLLQEYAAANNPWSDSDSISISCDHVTLFYYSDTDWEASWNWSVLHNGDEVDVTAVSVGNSDKCFALGIDTDIPVSSGVPHVTLLVNTTNGGMAWQSIQIQDWKALDKSVTLHGVVTLHKKGDTTRTRSCI